MVAVFGEIWRVLRDDGTCWLIIGDTYASGTRTEYTSDPKFPQRGGRHRNRASPTQGLKPKNLCMIPARLALALQGDGWYLRQDIAWIKKSPMPESVQDRFTSSWEHVWLLTKQPRYFFDLDAVAEPSTGFHGSSFTSAYDQVTKPGLGTGERTEHPTRHMRNVWILGPEPYNGVSHGAEKSSHYAIFPQALVERCIKAGTSQYGVCPHCAAPYRRIVDRQRLLDGHIPVSGTFARPDEPFRIPPNGKGHYRYTTQTTQQGWAPGCQCAAGAPVPAIVLDPFVGSGTTLLVARALGRHGIGCDLSWPYLHDQARTRLGLADLAAWEGHSAPPRQEDHTTLPLFAPQEEAL